MKVILLIFLSLNYTLLFAQKDSCITIEHNKNEVYLLTELNKISKDRLIGQLGKFIYLNDVQLIKQIDLDNFRNMIDIIFERKPELSDSSYKIQIVPFTNNLKEEYCEIIFQKELPDNTCYNTLILSQMDGGDSFCYFLFKLNDGNIIYNQCNNN